jgi:RimJ/RimL family protein N-acetyltransferase
MTADAMRFPAEHPTLESPRLVLRQHTMDDAAAFYAIYSDPPTMRFWSSPPMVAPLEARAAIANAHEAFVARHSLRFALVEREGGAMIGTCTLFGVEVIHRRAELGYVLRRDRWGRGLMREGLAALLDYAFGPLGLHRAEADVDPRNVPSVALLERLGFVREGVLRERWRVNGEVSDSLFLGLLAPDWPAARGER